MSDYSPNALGFKDLGRFLVFGELGNLPGLVAQIQALAPEQHEDLWQRVLNVAGEHIKSQPAGQEHANVFKAVAVLMNSFADTALDAKRVAVLPPSFVEVALASQEKLLSLKDGDTQGLIAHSLEKICTDGFSGREDFYGGVLMFLIGKCLEPKMTPADVARLHRVRWILAELDWEHASIESLKMQLMRCTASPSFMRSNHGSEMLASFFTVHPGFVSELHSTIKNQVTFSKPATLKAYSAALLKAWKGSQSGTRIQIEHCIQEWILLAIRTARKSADKARALLEELHRHHHEEGINDLLCRLYGPLLWRSLKVANVQVRENAAKLMQYTFPLLPNELGVQEKEQELAKQLRLLREALEDPGECVRRVAVSAVCVILKNYWDMMPPTETAELLTVLMNRCAKDRKAPLVRAAVAEGFGWILENALSHPTMAAVLPQLGDLLSDRAPVVRAAFVGLLNAVSCCRGVSVGAVVNNESLLLRLASEHAEGQAERLQRGLQACRPDKTVTQSAGSEGRASPEMVARQLARLVAPSLFQQDLAHQVARCQHLMQNWPLALLALLSHLKDLKDIAPMPERMKLAAALFRYGLREAARDDSEPNQQKPKMVATMLRVVGVLLAGTSVEPVTMKRGKKNNHADLQDFIYGHIREEDFLHLLKASHEDRCSGSSRMRDDLLFALSSLDPSRLPRTADLVRHEIDMACRGVATCRKVDDSQERDDGSALNLTALLRVATRWNILSEAMEPAWERLSAAAARLRQRQPAGAETEGALAVVEAALREPEVRASLLSFGSKFLCDVVEGFILSLESAWSTGLAEIRTPPPRSRAKQTVQDGRPRILGPAADLWPRIIGLTTRAALQLEHRASQNQQGMVATLSRLASTLTSPATLEIIDAAEGVVPPPAKRQRKARETAESTIAGAAGVVPADLSAIVGVHERLLETFNAVSFLAVLKGPSSAEVGEDMQAAASPTLMLHSKSMEEHLWRWASIAHAQAAGESATMEAWPLLGRFVQQMAHAGTPTPDLLAAVRRLLARVSNIVPEDSELKAVLCDVFQKLECDPQLQRLVAGILGTGSEADGIAEDAVFNARVKALVSELLPGYKHLRAQFLPNADDTARGHGLDQRRVFASPTPQKAGFRTLAAPASRESNADSLFKSCFDGIVGTSAPPSRAVTATDGEDAD